VIASLRVLPPLTVNVRPQVPALDLNSTRIIAALALGVVLGVAGCSQQRELAPGQVWSYDNRPGEGASTIQILHIERGTPVGDVYFVSVRALDVKRLGRKIRHTEVWPLAFTQEALTRSLGTYQWSQTVDRSYLKQLDFWLREARNGRAADRTFSVPVKEALNEIESERPDAEKRLFEGVS
jgi:hypothetical protein